MTLLAALVLAQGPAPLADLPFDHGDGHIWLKGSLNGKAASIVLDTGASDTVVDEKTALTAGAIRGETTGAAANGSAAVSAWKTKGLNVGLEGTTMVQPAAYALPLSGAMNGYVPSHPLEVILGADFLRRYAVEVDYVHARVRLFAPEAYRVPKGYAALPLRFVGGRPVVEGELRVGRRTIQKASMLVDTGAGAGLDLTKSLVQREGLGVLDLLSKIPVYAATVGLGGEVYLVDVPDVALRLGNVSLKTDARMVLSDGGASGANAGYDAILGDDVLKRLDLVLDFAHSRVFARANGR